MSTLSFFDQYHALRLLNRPALEAREMITIFWDRISGKQEPIFATA